MHKIQSIFPLPIYFNNINREYTDIEGEFITEQLDMMMANTSNLVSVNRYILDFEPLIDIKKFILEESNNYIKIIYDPISKIECEITQSWLNLSKTNDSHPFHWHPNSFLSGLLYIKANKKFDKIMFHKFEYEQIKIHSPIKNEYNCEEVLFAVETGDIVMFPSKIPHSVPMVDSNYRVSLAFNIFLKGKIGNSLMLSDLTL